MKPILWPGLAVAALLLALACGKPETDFGGVAPVIPKDTAKIDTVKALDTLRFATLNMSIGFPVSQLLFTDMANDTIAYVVLDSMYRRYIRGRPKDRIKAMARAIDSLKLDVVGLQEVMAFKRDGILVNDFLAELTADIIAMGGPAYQVLSAPLNDTVLAGAKGGKTINIAFHEGDAMLVNPAFKILDSANYMYFSLLEIPTAAGTYTERAMQFVKFETPKKRTWQAWNTHLEVVLYNSSSQASELKKKISEKSLKDSTGKDAAPIIVLGDFNVDPNTNAHTVMQEGGFSDTYSKVGLDTADASCCVDGSALWSPDTTFSYRRIDFIFARHILGVTENAVNVRGAFIAEDGTRLLATDHRMVRATVVGQ